MMMDCNHWPGMTRRRMPSLDSKLEVKSDKPQTPELESDSVTGPSPRGGAGAP